MWVGVSGTCFHPVDRRVIRPSSCSGSSVDVDMLVSTFWFVKPLKSGMELSAPVLGVNWVVLSLLSKSLSYCWSGWGC